MVRPKETLVRILAMVLPLGKFLEKVYFDFLNIIFFQIKKYQPIADRHISWRSPQIVQRFTKKESLFRDIKD